MQMLWYLVGPSPWLWKLFAAPVVIWPGLSPEEDLDGEGDLVAAPGQLRLLAGPPHPIHCSSHLTIAHFILVQVEF